MVSRAGRFRVFRALLSAVLTLALVPIGVAPANTLLPGPPMAVGSGPKGLTVGDVNNDGRMDIVTADYSGRTFTVLYQQVDGSFSPAATITVRNADGIAFPSSPGSIVVADVLAETDVATFNDNELVVGDTFSQTLYVYKLNASGGFDCKVTLPSYYDARVLVNSGPTAPAFDFAAGIVDAYNHFGLLAPVYRARANSTQDKGGFIVYRRLPNLPGVVAENGLTASLGGFYGARTTLDGLPIQGISTDIGSGLWVGRSDSSHRVDQRFDTGPIRAVAGHPSSAVMFAALSNNVIAVSGNNGATWMEFRTPETGDPAAHAVAWNSDTTVFEVGPGGSLGFIKLDGGQTDLVVPPSTLNVSSTVDLYSVTSPTSGEMLTCGSGGSVWNLDSSLSWIRTMDQTSSGVLRAISSAPNGNGAFAVGNSNVGVHLERIGGAWVSSTVGLPAANLRAIAYASSLTLVAVGESGAIIRSTDGGLTWSTIPSPLGGTDLKGIAFYSSLRGAIVSDSGALVTSDGGATWTPQDFSVDQFNAHRTVASDQDELTDFIGNPFTAAIGDVNGDNWPDFGVAGFQSGRFMPFYLGGNGASNIAIDFSLPSLLQDVRDVAIGDLNGDGLNDVVGASYTGGSVALSYQNSIGQLGAVTEATTFRTGDDTSPAPVSLAIGDLNQDGRNDLIAANSYNLGNAPYLRNVGSVGIYKQMPAGNMRFLGDIDMGRQPSGVAAGQLDTTPYLEVAVSNARDNTVQILKYALPNPPKIASASHPSTSTYSGSRYFSGTLFAPADFDGIEGFYYRLDKNPASTRTAAWDYTTAGMLFIDLQAAAAEQGVSAEGPWYLHAVSRDVLGNIGVVTAHYPILADLTAPTAPAPDDGVATYTASPRRVFTWAPSTDALSGVQHYLVSMDASSEAPADLARVETTVTTTQFTVDGLTDGEHIFRIRAQDRAGNYSAVGIHKAYVDAANPTLNVDEIPASLGISPEFGVHAYDGAGLTRLVLKVDGTTLIDQPISGTTVDAELNPDLRSFLSGPHVLTITAYDLLGHSSTFTRNFTLDKSGLQPIVTSTSHPDADKFSNTYIFKGQLIVPAGIGGVEGFYYTIDRKPSTVPTEGADFSATGSLLVNLAGVADEIGGSTEGTWTLHAVTRDWSGAAGTAVTHRQILVDTVVPSGTTPDDGVESWTTSPRRVFRWAPATDSLSGVARYWVSVDAASESATDLAAVETSQNVTKFTADGLSDGIHTFRVRAQDKAGNYGPVGLHRAYVDASPPTVSVSGLAYTVGAKPGIKTIARDGAGVTKLVVRVDGTTVLQRSTSGTSVTTTLTPDLSRFSTGAHTLTITAYDRLGHTATVQRNISLDKTAPAARVTASGSRRLVSVKVTGLTSTAKMTVTIDGGRVRNHTAYRNRTYYSRRMVPSRTDGNQTRRVRYTVRLEDTVGNVRNYSGLVTVKYWDLVKLGPDSVQIVYY